MLGMLRPGGDDIEPYIQESGGPEGSTTTKGFVEGLGAGTSRYWSQIKVSASRAQRLPCYSISGHRVPQSI